MPFYKISEMSEKIAESGSIQKSVPGELMKAGVVTIPDGVEPPLHVQASEEQFTLVLEGKLHYILGDEERILESGIAGRFEVGEGLVSVLQPGVRIAAQEVSFQPIFVSGFLRIG